jgi:RimJ/RimL family protein N-acetyltransferase
VYIPGVLDFGLGMKPELCGKGHGYAFVNLGLDFAGNTLNAKLIRLTVAAFNSRAIRVYESIGFQPISMVTHKITGKPFLIMTTKR